MISKGSVIVVSKVGLHARPAADFVRAVETCRHEVTVSKAGKRVPGSSILGILSLAAHQGEEIEIEVTGPNSDEVLAMLIAVVGQAKTQ